jgi:NAD+ synthase
MRVDFSRDVLKIDPEAVARRIEAFIRDTLKHISRGRGIVVGLSGGVDSAVTDALSARAIGPDRVYTVLLPERGSNLVCRQYGRMMSEAIARLEAAEYKEIVRRACARLGLE